MLHCQNALTQFSTSTKLWLFLLAVMFCPQTSQLHWQHHLTGEQKYTWLWWYGDILHSKFTLQCLKCIESHCACLDNWPHTDAPKYSPLVGSLLWGLLFGLTAFFFEAWFWLCSLHFFNWKLMNFHIIQAWVKQIAARQVILRGGKDTWSEVIQLSIQLHC